MIENAHKHLERAEPGSPRAPVLIGACREVGPALFFSLLVITVSFLPVFTLEAQEGRLFGPLAYTKTFSMAGAALLSVTLVPVLMMLFVRGRIMPEQKNPINRAADRRLPADHSRRCLEARVLTVLAGARDRWSASIVPAAQLGSRVHADPQRGHAALSCRRHCPACRSPRRPELLQMQDRIIKSFPEVASVFGKAGRAETATDPAPIEMFETVINLKPEYEWRPGMTLDKPDRRNGQGAADARRHQRLDHADQGAHRHAVRPASARRSASRCSARTWPNGAARQADREVVTPCPAPPAPMPSALIGGYYLDIEPDRDALARYGLTDRRGAGRRSPRALGGEAVTTTVEGRERYSRERPLSARTARQSRDHRPQVLVPLRGRRRWCRWARWPRSSVAQGRRASAPRMRCLSAYIYRRHPRPRHRQLRRRRAEGGRGACDVPARLLRPWSGQFEYMQRAIAKLEDRRAGDAGDHLPAALPQLRDV